MASSEFCRFDLRTTDPDAARTFYSEVVGLDCAGAPSSDDALAIWPLHEQARARGAPAHWLGHIGVADVEATRGRLLAAGAEPLGPVLRAAGGAPFAMLRDPFGAVVAIRGGQPAPARTPVAWHHLHTNDLDRAWAVYSELFGWAHTETLEVPEPVGGYRMFAWEGSGKSVGSMANTARAPGVHAHWLYFFPVGDIDGALAKVRAHGGTAPAHATLLPNGDRLAPCEDAQGAAFGLHQSAVRAHE